MRMIGATLAVLALLAIATPAHAADELHYVALGDSYAAGLGLEPLAAGPAAGCRQSADDYPHRLAETLGATLDDRTCSGAVTTNIRDTAQRTGDGTAAVQSKALNADTDLVTITIGGNDLGFGSIVSGCLSLGPDGPALAHRDLGTCRAYYEREAGVDELLERLQREVLPDLRSTFEVVWREAPNAEVVVVGYPSIAPSAEHAPDGCFSSPIGAGGLATDAFPYQRTDSLYLHEIEQHLDDALRTAADEAGFAFVPVWSASQTHAACSRQPFVSGITFTTDAAAGFALGIDGLYLRHGALHPNDAGVAFVTGRVAQTVRDLDGTPPQQRVRSLG